ncbi:hypothetical protein JCM19000A_36140 [Silvimonas sp. JCM 19000]
MLELNEDQLRLDLGALSHEHRALFGLSLCERLLPNASIFAQRHNLDYSGLRQYLNSIWENIDQGHQFDFFRLAAECEAVAPDTEDYDDPLVSSALDAVVATSNLLRFMVDDAVGLIVEISVLACDTVDMYIQEADGLDIEDPDFEQKILSHALMQAEIQRQIEDLSFISTLTLIDKMNAAALRSKFSNKVIGNIGLA